MFSLENFLDLPLIWFGLLVTALFLYVFLDGFDLGVGVLFPFAPSDECRDRMMNSIAPFWDGNETWLVLSGGGLFAAFPLAYSILMPALYMPVILMLLGLIFRGVAFEFRFKAAKSRFIWDYSFHFGSIVAAFMQGMILGAFVKGVQVEGRSFAGHPFDWLNAYSFIQEAELRVETQDGVCDAVLERLRLVAPVEGMPVGQQLPGLCALEGTGDELAASGGRFASSRAFERLGCGHERRLCACSRRSAATG